MKNLENHGIIRENFSFISIQHGFIDEPNQNFYHFHDILVNLCNFVFVVYHLIGNESIAVAHEAIFFYCQSDEVLICTLMCSNIACFFVNFSGQAYQEGWNCGKIWYPLWCFPA